MTTSLRIVSGPADEPISVEEAKVHLRATEDAEEDELIDALIGAAREAAEHETGRLYGLQTVEATLAAWPAGAVELAAVPFFDLLSVKYLDADGVEQTMDPDLYVLDAASPDAPARLLRTSDAWPTLYDAPAAVKVRFRAGHAGEGVPVPKAVKAWMLLVVGELYANRETSATALAESGFASRLLDRARTYR